MKWIKPTRLSLPRMPDLASTQNALAAALVDNDDTQGAIALIDATQDIASARVAIYRNNILSNARNALAASFPIVVKIVGAEFFGTLARAYCASHPSSSGDLNEFGEQFAEFIDSFAHTQALPYLADVARVEWLTHRARYAADHPPIDMQAVASITCEHYERLIMDLHPSVAILASRYPVYRIWEVHQRDYVGEVAVDLSSGAESVVVYRRQFQTDVAPLTAAEYVLLGEAARKQPLGHALQLAFETDAAFDFSASLQRWIRAAIVVGLRNQ